MKTRNKFTGSRIATSSSKSTNQSTNSSLNDVAIDSPSSPPRLRDRRSSGLEAKANNSSSLNETQRQSTSPSAGAKRPSTGPTRVLPKRSCGRPNSLLADHQPNPSAINNKTKLLLKFPNKTPEPASPKKDTHKRPAVLPLNDTTLEKDELMSEETAAIKHVNNDKSMNGSTSSTSNNQNDDIEMNQVSVTDKLPKQLVCISLPQDSLGAQSLTTDKSKSTDHLPVPAEDTSKTAAIISNKKVFNVLIGVTGSVATIKLIELTNQIKSRFPRECNGKSDNSSIEMSVSIKIVMTKNSLHFAPKNELIEKLNDPNIEIYDDSDEWSLWEKINDPVLHIDLRKWADLFLIAPLDANTLAKLANGLCDNLLTCVVRAWDNSKPLIYCPAMNVHMYNHPITRDHLCKLQSFGYFRVNCVEKRLACGDYGMGGMASVEAITNKVVDTLIQPQTRKLSLTKPLLNQQPTYPIISTTEETHCQPNLRFSPAISNQILNRFKTNNQITVHPVPYCHKSQNQPSKHRAIAESLLKRQDSTSNSIDFGGNKLSSTNDESCKYVMGGVTSVQNLKAIAFDDISEFAHLEDDELGIDIDPTELLEQSMVTGESLIMINNDHTTNSTMINQAEDSFDNGSLFEQGVGGITKIDSLTPFETSKFLALCHNKERGCFTCTICKHDYKNRKSMARHLKEQHVQGNIYQCKPCGVSYKRREKLVKHLRERHQDI